MKQISTKWLRLFLVACLMLSGCAYFKPEDGPSNIAWYQQPPADPMTNSIITSGLQEIAHLINKN
jgi:hypothetical protein